MKARKPWSLLRRQRFEARRDQVRAWRMTAHVMMWAEHMALHAEVGRGPKEDSHELHVGMHLADLRAYAPEAYHA